MTETPSEMRPGTWQVPECPQLITYSPAVLDEIRLAAVDAFFSLPRGGAEIGGVLLGRHDGSSVRIEAFRPMECEHAMGPTFVLSEKDKQKLRTMLAESSKNPVQHGLEVVGWYHTHTRSEIFLSDLDLEIYHRYFPEPWQVALLMRPAGMKPTRAGFFFRDRDGAVRSSASYREFIVTPLGEGYGSGNGRHAYPPAPAPSVRTVPSPAPPAAAAPEPGRATAPARAPAADPEPLPPVEETALLPAATAMLQRIDATPARRLDAGPPIEMRPAEFVPPAFMIPDAKEPSRRRLWLGLALLAAVGAGAYATSGYWMRMFSSKPVFLHLQALDHDGQLRIQWDRAAMSSADAQSGALVIVDGAAGTTIPLDASRLRSGSFQYARRTEVVEVHLTVKTPRGAPLEEFTSFYGQPKGQPGARNLEQQKKASDLAAEKARGDLKKEELRTLELERSLEQMKQMVRRDEERKRVENQIPANAAPASDSRPPAAPTQTANTNPAPRSNPPAVNAPPPAPPTVNAAPQVKPQASAQSLATQAARPITPQPDKSSAAVEHPGLPPAPIITQPPPARPAALPPQSVSKPAPAPPPPSLSGKWVFSPASKSGSAFPPESVTLMVVDGANSITGTFAGRYKVPKNIGVSPKVNFSFEGPSRSSRFAFTAANGMKGEIELIRLPGKQNAIEVVWYSERDKLRFDDIFFRVP